MAERVLVDVHDLGLAETEAALVREEQRGQVAGVGRRVGVDGRVDLDAGGDAHHRHAVADGVEDVARRAVAAGEQDEVGAGVGHAARRLFGVGGVSRRSANRRLR